LLQPRLKNAAKMASRSAISQVVFVLWADNSWFIS